VNVDSLIKSLLRAILATFGKMIHEMPSVKIAKLCKEHVYVFFCQMPKTKARSGAFQKGAYVRSNRRQGHVALHHFETAHSCEFIGHYKKRHTYAPSQALRASFWR
jgi:hypothetical protein